MSAGWSYVQSRVYMDTIVTIEVPDPAYEDQTVDRVECAFGWFGEVERTCNRFDEASALRQLCRYYGRPAAAPPMLLGALSVALEVARLSNGAFDPTVGALMEASGFDIDYRSGDRRPSRIGDRAATYHDVKVDLVSGTVTLARPLLLDLGAVAKGLAIDLAGREMAALGDFAINAGGDILVQGRNAAGEPWTVGVRDPADPVRLAAVLEITGGAAVCTSGDYERSTAASHHILDPRTGASAGALASVTVIAPSAMLADAISTAAFALGPHAGQRLVEEQCVEALLITPAAEVIQTAGMAKLRR